MSFRHSSLNGIPRMTVTPQSRLRTLEDTISDISTSHMSKNGAFLVLSLHKILRDKTGLFEVPQRNCLPERTWRGVSCDVCVLAFTGGHLLHSPAQILHVLSLEAMYTENCDLFHPCRWSSGFQLLTRMKHHPEVSSDTHWPQKTATSPW